MPKIHVLYPRVGSFRLICTLLSYFQEVSSSGIFVSATDTLSLLLLVHVFALYILYSTDLFPLSLPMTTFPPVLPSSHLSPFFSSTLLFSPLLLSPLLASMQSAPSALFD